MSIKVDKAWRVAAFALLILSSFALNPAHAWTPTGKTTGGWLSDAWDAVSSFFSNNTRNPALEMDPKDGWIIIPKERGKRKSREVNNRSYQSCCGRAWEEARDSASSQPSNNWPDRDAGDH